MYNKIIDYEIMRNIYRYCDKKSVNWNAKFAFAFYEIKNKNNRVKE